MLLVILGAGASYNSAPPSARGPVTTWRPPLAADLFVDTPEYVEILGHHRHAAPIVAQARWALTRGEPLEQLLELLRDEADRYPMRRGHLLGVQFYLRELLSKCTAEWHRQHGGVTNYVHLVDVLEASRLGVGQEIMYVTFNYDTLLERALGDAGIKSFDGIADYVAGPVRVLKPHGSIDWVQSAEWQGGQSRYSALFPAQLCDMVDSLSIRSDYQTHSGRLDAQPLDRLLLPAIAIPTRTKGRFACPEGHMAQFTSLLPSVSGVLAVGWRGGEDHFLELLRTGLGPDVQALVVTESPESSGTTARALQGSGIARVISFSEGILWTHEG